MNTFIQDNILQTKYNPPRFFIQFSVKAVLDRTLPRALMSWIKFSKSNRIFF